MKDKTFRIIVIIIAAAGVLSTAGLAAYTVSLHRSCSIITYVGN